MRSTALWLVLIVAILVMSLAGFLAAGTLLRAAELCPDGNDCEDARTAGILFSAITAGSAVVLALAWRGLGSRPTRNEP